MYDLITSRAVSDAATLRDLAEPFMGPESVLLLYKGDKTAAEADGIPGAEVVATPHARYITIRKQP